MGKAQLLLVVAAVLLGLGGHVSLSVAKCSPSPSALILFGIPFAGPAAASHVDCDSPESDELPLEPANYEEGNYPEPSEPIPDEE